LLTKKRRPDWRVALEAIAIEGIEPAGARVEILAFLRVAAIVGLVESPAIGDEIEDVAHGRERVWSEFGNVIGIGVQAMAKFAVRARRRLRRGRSGGAEFGKTREPRPSFCTG
jgi:hypothetical protein